MWSLPGILGIGVLLIYLFGEDVAAEGNRYTAVLAKMEAEFKATKGLTDPAEVRRRHFETMKTIGDFDRDPCDDFMAYSCGGFFKQVNESLPKMTDEQFHYEILKFQMKHILQSDNLVLEDDSVSDRAFKTFFDSCLEFEGVQKAEGALDGVLKKLGNIIDDAAHWSDAVVALHGYGIDVFYTISYDEGIKIRFLRATNAGSSSAENESGFKYTLAEFDETFPVFHLRKFLKEIYFITNDNFNFTALNLGLMENLNTYLSRGDEEDIKQTLKTVVKERVLQELAYFTETDLFSQCYDVAFKYFEAAIQKIYMQNRLSPEDKARATEAIRRINRKFKGAIEIDGPAEPAITRKMSLMVDAAFPAFHTDTSWHYDSFELDPEKGFPDLLFDVISSDYQIKKTCLGYINISLRSSSRDVMVVFSAMSNNILCREYSSKSIPIDRLSVPFYNPSYPVFWNLASFTSAYYWHLFKYLSDEMTGKGYKMLKYPLDEVLQRLVTLYEDAVPSQEGKTADILGYEDLNLNPYQAFYVALVQTSCAKVEDNQMFRNVQRGRNMANLFNCNPIGFQDNE